jgi:hypothetical protein
MAPWGHHLLQQQAGMTNVSGQWLPVCLQSFVTTALCGAAQLRNQLRYGEWMMHDL